MFILCGIEDNCLPYFGKGPKKDPEMPNFHIFERCCRHNFYFAFNFDAFPLLLIDCVEILPCRVEGFPLSIRVSEINSMKGSKICQIPTFVSCCAQRSL